MIGVICCLWERQEQVSAFCVCACACTRVCLHMHVCSWEGTEKVRGVARNPLADPEAQPPPPEAKAGRGLSHQRFGSPKVSLPCWIFQHPRGIFPPQALFHLEDLSG